ncbi:ribonuclease H2 subunit B-like [Daphnia pulicaria]|uniref:ribonuclease H2 subunit B-like n=1 Tax=Daphnia pulicaria TaxID=35523 RepID=UPI001EEA0244|nr:ribonuclease H2 subunit B-like [Daphnia pulicaria]
MPRITRNNSIKESVVDVSSSPEKDTKSNARNATISAVKTTHPESQCVMIVPDGMLNDNQRGIVVGKLRNPKTGTGTLYAFSHNNTKLYEMNQFDENKRSWFIDNSVQSDGSFFLTTTIDPLFVIIPYLQKAKHTSPIDQLLVDEEYTDTGKLSLCSKKEDLEKIADCKQSGTFQAWKYNEGKTFDWLGKKVSRLTQHLKDKNFNVTQSAVSSNYVKTDSATVPESLFTRYAFGLISEYLSDELSAALEKHLDLPAVPKFANNDDVKEPPAKRQKFGSVIKSEPTEDYSKDQKPFVKEKIQVSAKSKALASAAKGSKSIASFFGKK